jgi:hypothetical protein
LILSPDTGVVSIEFRFLGLRQELLISHRFHEGVAQRIDAIFANPRRRREGAPHHLATEDELEDRALLVGLGEVHDQGHVREVGVLAERVLH